METFTVYMATNTVNGKRYIGATSRGLDVRKARHFADSKRKNRECPAFYAAIRKYGQDSFRWEVIVTLSTSLEMYKEEERLIAAMNPEYNIASGGLVFISKSKQKEFQQRAAQKKSKPVICLNDGRIFPSGASAARAYGLESRQSVGLMCRKKSLSMKDHLAFAFLEKPMTDEERLHLLSSIKSRRALAEASRVKKLAKLNGRSVTCLNDGAIYQSALAAERATGLARGIVQYLCKTGKTHTAGALCFSYGAITGQERLRLFEEAKAKKIATVAGWKEKLSKLKSYVVVCVNTGERYPNTAAAGRVHGLSYGRIAELCRDGGKSSSGMSFSYLDSQ